MLTCSGIRYGGDLCVVTWGLQTGGTVSAISQRYLSPDNRITPCITYSKDGKMVGVLRPRVMGSIISVYNVISGVHLCDICDHTYSLLNTQDFNKTWTHGESLRFATQSPAPITIWEARFTPRVAFTQIETLSVPGNTPNKLWSRVVIAQISPTSYRLALFYSNVVREVFVWDTGDSKLLLHHTDVGSPFRAAFSSDGRFFACSSDGSGVYLWKEDSTGYRLHGKLASDIPEPIPLFSPDGESIITFGGASVRSWHTKLPPPTPPSAAPQNSEDFVLDFLPDRSAVAVARLDDNVVVILDLESGIPYLTIDTGLTVHGLRVIENVVAVIGDGKIVTWNLPGRSSPPATQMKPEDSARTITFDTLLEKVTFVSMSPDFHRVAIVGWGWKGNREAYILDLSTRIFRALTCSKADAPWFPPGDGGLLCFRGDSAAYWKLDSDRPDQLALHGTHTSQVLEGCPWVPSHGYKITDDGWILGPGRKRLLMLPPSWRSDRARRVWNGQFLALSHGSLPEPVILDLEPRAVPSL